MKKNYAFALAMLAILTNLCATDYYIDANNGNDGNNGLSSTSAFKSLYKIDALNLQPGDIVYFMEGTYLRSGQTLLTVSESGSANDEITFTNYQDHKPILEFDNWTGIEIVNGAGYLRFEGLSIKGARSKVNLSDALAQGGGCSSTSSSVDGLYNGTGFLAVGPNLSWSNPSTTGNEVPHHITIENCEVYDCTSSGIAFQQADYVTIKNNKVYNNAWYTIYGTSGINLYQFINTDGTTGFHNEVSNNLMYGNMILVPQVPNCAYYDGNGLIVDDFKHLQTYNYKDQSLSIPSYDAKTIIKNNIAVENGGSGLHFYLSTHCHVFNNTVVNNATQNSGNNGNAELRVGSCEDFIVQNNIFDGGVSVHKNGGNVNFTYTHNYQFGPNIDSDLVGCTDCVEDVALAYLNTDITDNAPYITADNSAIVNQGINQIDVSFDYLMNNRTDNGTFDIGAYSLEDNTIITGLVSIQGLSIGSYVSYDSDTDVVTCNSSTVTPTELYTIESQGGNVVTIKGPNGKYLSSENGSIEMRSNRNVAKSWEQFTLEHLGGDEYTIMGNNGRYVSHEQGTKGMYCNRSVAKSWESFIIVSAENIASRTSPILSNIEIVENPYEIYPIPFNGAELNIRIHTPFSATASIEIIDLQGRSLISRDLGMTQEGTNTYSLDDSMSELSGFHIYLAKVVIGNKVYTSRIVRQ